MQPTPRPSLASLLLGGFVVWQLLFLFLDNAFDYLAWRTHADGPTNALTSAFKEYGRLTGQTQYWRLFAPGVERDSTFATVELVEDGEKRTLLSRFDPAAGPRSRRFGADDRLYNCEQNVTLRLYLPWEAGNTAENQAERVDALRRRWRPALAYMLWRADEERQRHPEMAAPREVILSVRVYSEGAAVETRPLARWRLGGDLMEDVPLEVYDPGERRFAR